jgi:hypothetical protein
MICLLPVQTVLRVSPKNHGLPTFFNQTLFWQCCAGVNKTVNDTLLGFSGIGSIQAGLMDSLNRHAKLILGAR